MTLKEIERKLRTLKTMGYIPTVRKGSTGVGHTFEQKMGLPETNIPVPDLGGRVEIKTTRRDASSPVTLFCFNRGVWHISQKELIEKYGYIDDSGRKALKNIVYTGRQISQGLSLIIDDANNKVSLKDENGKLLATWDVFVMVGKLVSKLSKVLFVIADRRFDANGEEEFLYKEAYILTDPIPRNFINAFKSGKVGIDLRMHLKENGTVRNRGTAFRIKEADLWDLYSNSRNLGI
ncbi:MAG: hypothetical protein HZB54_00725 [Deltaproteobacteria bacterium]|nr:hypothetical protein [Deltaproteobacteria bacterium]